MTYISPKNYCQQHLDELQEITGESCWFEFLDREDRMIVLMRRSEPMTTDGESRLTWDYLYQLVGRNFFGLWPEPTEQEKWLANQIAEINREWLDTSSFAMPDSEIALSIKKRFDQLSGQVIQAKEKVWTTDASKCR